MDQESVRLCACGCGEPIDFAMSNPKLIGGTEITRRGRVRFKPGHYARTIKPYRPFVLTRQRVAEMLGRPVKPGEVVWESPWGLVICSRSAYATYAARMRAHQATGNANKIRCEICHDYELPQDLRVYQRSRGGVIAFHPECKAIADSDRRAKRTASRPLNYEWVRFAYRQGRS